MTRNTSNLVVSGLLAWAAACGGSEASTPGGSAQVVGGTAALSTFPAKVSSARVMQASKLIAEAQVAVDGTFELNIPAGKAYRIELVNGKGAAGLVFPRKTGVVEHTFDVVNGGQSFDLGIVRYVGDPAAQQFRFGAAASAGPAQKKAEVASGGDGECEDGIDATTGAICVDDQDDEGLGACSADGEANDGEENDGEASDGEENDGEANDGEENDGVDCVDGLDAATGAECDGGPAANQADGEENDGEANDGEQNDDEGTPSEAAVADHNLPSAVCAPDDEEEQD